MFFVTVFGNWGDIEDHFITISQGLKERLLLLLLLLLLDLRSRRWRWQ
jgi:hypothetical protein